MLKQLFHALYNNKTEAEKKIFLIALEQSNFITILK